ncbi:hypothetical protein SRDD_05940 [Serratia sp. DD3]|nr:hypothetical protein SRDD_05940 [Serratia sp. DD3]
MGINSNLSPFVAYLWVCCRQFETDNTMILNNKINYQLSRRFKETSGAHLRIPDKPIILGEVGV